MFYNPPEWANDSGVGGGGGRGEGGGGVQVRMREVMGVFVRQLQMLLGLPSLVSSITYIVDTV